uniref:Uncharacterized protein n=1 Tax=Arsenophonus endosymbiont of Trialeurodes vaporariorum TaxID=235567 RepID=A0A3B0LWS0_9GAMM
MGENGVVELTLPSGKTVKLESIKALQELVEGKADTNSVEEVKESLKEAIEKVNQGLEKKADTSSVEEINKTVAAKFDKTDVV